jgi:hypothetical protein
MPGEMDSLIGRELGDSLSRSVSVNEAQLSRIR